MFGFDKIRKENIDFKEAEFSSPVSWRSLSTTWSHLLRSCGSMSGCEENKLLRVARGLNNHWNISKKKVTTETVVSIPAPPLHYSADPAWGLDPDAYQHACPTTWPRHIVAWQGAKVESLKRNCAKAAPADGSALGGEQGEGSSSTRIMHLKLKTSAVAI